MAQGTLLMLLLGLEFKGLKGLGGYIMYTSEWLRTSFETHQL